MSLWVAFNNFKWAGYAVITYVHYVFVCESPVICVLGIVKEVVLVKTSQVVLATQSRQL